jgi:hypothetical protein
MSRDDDDNDDARVVTSDHHHHIMIILDPDVDVAVGPGGGAGGGGVKRWRCRRRFSYRGNRACGPRVLFLSCLYRRRGGGYPPAGLAII